MSTAAVRWFRAVRVPALVLFATGVLLAAWSALRQDPGTPAEPVLSAPQVLGSRADATGFARADAPRTFRFPDDHGPHREFQSEWWYWTGVLDGPEGRRFGYQLTFFRFALSPEPKPEPKPGPAADSTAARKSAWAASQVYMAHFTLTDAGARKFRAFEKVAREALELAGARAAPFRVWVLDWAADGPPRSDIATPIRLRAAGDGAAIELELDQGKPPVLQGDRGLSRKGGAPGNASYYYSLTRMPTRGVITAGAEKFEVRGESWMDREWSTSALEPDQVGWDWLGLALADGRELMFFRLRRADGSVDPNSGGSLVEPDGAARHLGANDVTLAPLGTWRSPRTKTVYPSTFRLDVPSARIALVLRPLLDDQELDLSFRYWEGAVTAVSQEQSSAPGGRGYLELTGYGEGKPGAR
jgi:predicted secreted hydrolase